MMGSAMLGYNQLMLFDAMMAQDILLKRQKVQLTFNDGGNCLVGEHEGKKYAIIGRDAVVLNQFYLSEQLAQIGIKKNSHGQWQLGNPYDPKETQLSEEDIKKFMAHDLGLESPDLVYVIEQPDYHLDTSMIILRGKEVLLNDSLMTFEVMQEYEKTLKMEPMYRLKQPIFEERMKKLEQDLKEVSIYENAAAADLTKHHFQVRRVAGSFKNVFRNHPENHRANFFNLITLTTPANQKVIFAMKSEAFFNKKLIALIHQHMGEDIPIHWLNQKDCEELLLDKGGIHCLTKLLNF